jgi:hypothetical protein
MNNDLHLFYYGASGGFFALHLLLLTEQYQCVFVDQDQNFETIFQNQWNITNPSKWKQQETWPDNDNTLTTNFEKKIYYTCNNVNEIGFYPAKLIVIYTDIETQWLLASTKRAFWFTDNTNEQVLKTIHQEFVEYYQTIKGFDWPECQTIQDFNFLPDYVKKECIEHWGVATRWTFSNPEIEKSFQIYRTGISMNYRGDKVYNKLITELDITRADIVIKLQDLIKTKGEILFEQLGIKGNQKTNDFVDLWLSKHTPEQLKYLINEKD